MSHLGTLASILGRLLPLALLLALLAQPATAQLASMSGDDGPVTIEADNGIEWVRDAQKYIARGNAKATRGDVTVNADTLTATYRDGKNGQTEIWRLEAEGKVVMRTPTETAYGDRAVYNMDLQRLRLTGKNLKLVAGSDTVTARDTIDYFQGKQVAVATGDAVAIRLDRRIRADVLTARFQPDRANQLQLAEVQADGNVVITTPNEVARGKSGVYDVSREIATLTGDVKITQGKNQLNGQRAEVNMRTGVSRLLAGKGGDGRVRGLFVPQEGSRSPAPGRSQ
ncbi:LptA/OstA family protein [Oceanibaculum pacificum]|uniref:LptA/OstA family protein n=1 Tax=Oceanibaculum pacificum TaxID=580166 RepID=UPI001E2855C0|nr:LptA/OstA family protein [Oceanibaculum pacificum]